METLFVKISMVASRVMMYHLKLLLSILLIFNYKTPAVVPSIQGYEEM